MSTPIQNQLDFPFDHHSLIQIMSSVLQKAKSNNLDVASEFEEKSPEKGAVWLDSSLACDDWGRRSLVTVQPIAELVLYGSGSMLYLQNTDKVRSDRAGFYRELEKLASEQNKCAIGFISYEAALPWLGIQPCQPPNCMPDAHFFVYDKVNWLENISKQPDKAWTSANSANPGHGSAILQPTISAEQYIDRVRQIKWHIREGDIYQANFTCRFDVDSPVTPFEAYKRLRRLNPAPYSAFINFGDYQVLSSSPERMFFKEGNRIHSSPIKGTIKRGSTPQETAVNLEHLLNSAKDRAELLMIVDLVRNDLGKIARTGTVRVEKLFRAEVYSSLIHLIADISAELKPDIGIEDIFRALLPGGSITGTPKKRAVEIIEEMESTRRSVYTGCIGYIDGDRADFNLAIRTIMHRDGCYQIHAGSGIVADSDPEAEYEEMLLKARNLFAAVGIGQ